MMNKDTPVTKAFKILAYVTAALVGLLGLVFATIIVGMIVELFLKGIGVV